jgi:hypothetical protein
MIPGCYTLPPFHSLAKKEILGTRVEHPELRDSREPNTAVVMLALQLVFDDEAAVEIHRLSVRELLLFFVLVVTACMLVAYVPAKGPFTKTPIRTNPLRVRRIKAFSYATPSPPPPPPTNNIRLDGNDKALRRRF